MGSITKSLLDIMVVLAVPNFVSFVIPIVSITQVVRLSGNVNDTSAFPHIVCIPPAQNAVSFKSSLIILNIACHPLPHPHLLPLFANALKDW